MLYLWMAILDRSPTRSLAADNAQRPGIALVGPLTLRESVNATPQPRRHWRVVDSSFAARDVTTGASPLATLGFTLLELLVVVAIIGVLAAVLLPALGHAQSKAAEVRCLNNVRQLQLAWQVYTDDHQGYVPENHSDHVDALWRGSSNSWTGPSSALFDTTTTNLQQGSFYRLGYIRSLTIFRCPSDDANALSLAWKPLDGVDRTRSYAMNGNFGGRSQDAQKVIDREHLAFDPSRVFVFLDEQEMSIDDGHFLVWRSPDDRWVNMPADRHNSGANLSFADGHVESWRWKWPKDYWKQVEFWKPVEGQEDLEDLRRLQSVILNP